MKLLFVVEVCRMFCRHDKNPIMEAQYRLSKYKKGRQFVCRALPRCLILFNITYISLLKLVSFINLTFSLLSCSVNLAFASFKKASSLRRISFCSFSVVAISRRYIFFKLTTRKKFTRRSRQSSTDEIIWH